MPNISVSWAKAAKKPAVAKLKYSNWFLTIVPNFTDPAHASPDRKDEAVELKQQYTSAMKSIFSSDSIMDYINTDDPSKIVSIDIEASNEIQGPPRFYFHSHVMLRITHRTSVHLDYKKLKEDIAASVGKEPGQIHFKPLLFTDSKSRLADYIAKNPK